MALTGNPLEMLGLIAYVALHIISLGATWICGILIIVILVMGIISKALPLDVLITTIVTVIFTLWMLMAKVAVAMFFELDRDEEESKCVPNTIEFIVNCVTLALWFTIAALDHRFLSGGTFSCSRDSFSGDYCKIHQALGVLSILNGSIYATLNFFILFIPLIKCMLHSCTCGQPTPNPLNRTHREYYDVQSHTRGQDLPPPPRIYRDPQSSQQRDVTACADGHDPQPLPRGDNPKYGDGRGGADSALVLTPSSV